MTSDDAPTLRGTAAKDIRLVLCDIDGCLNSGFSAALDLPVLARIATQITALDQNGISLTLCTGRPAAYAQAMAQVLGICVPLVAENGAVLLDPVSGQVDVQVASDDRRSLMNFGEAVLSDPKWAARLQREIGKEACLSFNSDEISGQPPDQIRRVMQHLRARPGADRFFWSHSTTAIDIVPRGVSKASGTESLLRRLRLSWSAVASIGDSNNDLPVLNRAGLAMCPMNAATDVKDRCHHVAERPYATGVSDLLEIIS